VSLTAAPQGFQPVYHPSGNSRGEAYSSGIASGYATGIAKGAPVTLNSTGQIIAVTGTGVDILGVFAGVEYVDQNGVPTGGKAWPAGAQWSSNCTAYVWRDEETVYKVQADGTIGLANTVGNQAVGSNFGNAGGTGKDAYSQATVSATLVGSGNQGQWRVIGFAPLVDNAPGDPFPWLYVQNARPLYRALKTAN
jgi:hypothetical protein